MRGGGGLPRLSPPRPPGSTSFPPTPPVAPRTGTSSSLISVRAEEGNRLLMDSLSAPGKPAKLMQVLPEGEPSTLIGFYLGCKKLVTKYPEPPSTGRRAGSYGPASWLEFKRNRILVREAGCCRAGGGPAASSEPYRRQG